MLVKRIPRSQPFFCKARRIPQPLKGRVKLNLGKIVRQGILVEPLMRHQSCATDEKRALRMRVELKVIVSGKIRDEDYPISDIRTIFHNLQGNSYFGKLYLSDAYCQCELHEDSKELCTMNTYQEQFNMCMPPQGLKKSSTAVHDEIEWALKKTIVLTFFKTITCYVEQQVCNMKQMLAVISPIRGKFYHQQAGPIQNQPQALVFFLKEV